MPKKEGQPSRIAIHKLQFHVAVAGSLRSLRSLRGFNLESGDWRGHLLAASLIALIEIGTASSVSVGYAAPMGRERQTRRSERARCSEVPVPVLVERAVKWRALFESEIICQ